MSDTPVKNPYEYELPSEEIRVSRGAAIGLSVVFCLLLGIPPLWQKFPLEELGEALRGSASPNTHISERLKRFETTLEQQLSAAEPARQFAQGIFLTVLNSGNNQTVVGKNGWLFYRPEIQALTGLGPLRPEPNSVTKDPSKLAWQPPWPTILEFHKQLSARGIELWLVPVPMKESIYPEHLTGRIHNAPVTHPDEPAFADQCREAGMRYVELVPLLWQLKQQDGALGPVYLKQDTHWAPRGMNAAAQLLADAVRQHLKLNATRLATDASLVSRSEGDLLEKLDLAAAQTTFQTEQTTVTPVLLAKTDSASPIVLLGDSFVNIFHDPSLGFAPQGSAEAIQAGFAQHLMAELGTGIDAIATNGGGASTVREQFAKKPDDVVRAKKLVIWVLAARDLFLARTDAMANQVEWKSVTFNPQTTDARPKALAGDSLSVEATVVEISEFPANPKVTPYADALVSVKYRVDAVKHGSLEEKEIVVVHWLFKKREFLPAAKLKPGQNCVLNLVPWTDKLEAYHKRLLDDFGSVVDTYFQDTP